MFAERKPQTQPDAMSGSRQEQHEPHTTPETFGMEQASGRLTSWGWTDSSGAQEKTGTWSPVRVSMSSRAIRRSLLRALIYGLVSYTGLVLINNSELALPNMWIAYLPMFIGVYVVTQWLDRRLGG